MTHRNGIRLLALAILLAGCSESEPQSIKDKSEPLTSADEIQSSSSDENTTQTTSSTEEPITNSIGMKLQLLPAGKFVMGSDSPNAEADERPAHEVSLTQSFYIGMHEITQEQYEKVMGDNPSEKKAPQEPVANVRWNDAVEYCKRLSNSAEEKTAGRVYRLPTEAEWEYACRAGTTTKFRFGADESHLSEYAWFDESRSRSPQRVGQKKPNKWGLYDMHGNVSEWCHDRHGDYPIDAVTDPLGPSSGAYRVRRGGNWGGTARSCRSSNRYGFRPSARSRYLGFRLAAFSHTADCIATSLVSDWCALR